MGNDRLANMDIAGGIRELLLSFLQTQAATPQFSLVARISDYNFVAKVITGDQPYLVKVAGEPSRQSVSALVHFLKAEGYPLPDTAHEFSLEWNQKKLYARYAAFLPLETYTSDESAIETLLHALAAFHCLLRSFPQAASIKEDSKAYEQRLLQVRDHYLSRAPGNDRLRKEIAAYVPLNQEQPGSQCLHGDLHPGNIALYQGKPVFFDLDEAYKTFAPPYYDLCYLYTRVISFLPAAQQEPYFQLMAALYENNLYLSGSFFRHESLNILRRLMLMVLLDNKRDTAAETNKFIAHIDRLLTL
jgi:Ser/Thr protein kinase RdoA (MazF antagonist)